MPRYIDADALKKRLDLVGCVADNLYGMGINRGLERAETEIDMLPTADVVEVVRCKDCKHWGGVTYGFVCRKFSGINTKICMGADCFCSYGERKEEAEI